MIKVGYLVSSEYRMVFHSLRLIYEYVDEIYLAIDKDLVTYGGNKFEIEASFYEDIKAFDKDHKIQFYFDSFYVPGLNGLECETRERNMLAKKMGKGWVLQLDTDEYPYDFGSVAAFLRKHKYLTYFPKLVPVTLKGKWITLFKQTEDGFLYIGNEEVFYFGTNVGEFTFSRQNKKNYHISTNIEFIHQSWARSEEEIKFKLENWGHKDDFDTQKFFEFWKGLSKDNYISVRDFHPISPKVWDKLHFVPAKDIDTFMEHFGRGKKQEITPITKMDMLKIAIKNLIGRK